MLRDLVQACTVLYGDSNEKTKQYKAALILNELHAIDGGPVHRSYITAACGRKFEIMTSKAETVPENHPAKSWADRTDAEFAATHTPRQSQYRNTIQPVNPCGTWIRTKPFSNLLTCMYVLHVCMHKYNMYVQMALHVCTY